MSKEHRHSLSQDDVIHILKDGYNSKVREFTQTIENSPDVVMIFESIFNDVVRDFDVFFDKPWQGTPELNAFFTGCVQSVEALSQYIADMSPQRNLGKYLHFSNHGKEITVEFGWIDSLAGKVIWDRWTQFVDDPVICFAYIGFLFDHHTYVCKTKERTKADPPLYRYHPERFRAFYSFADTVGKIYRHEVDLQSGMPTLDRFNEIQGIIISEFNKQTMRYPRKLTLDSSPSALVMEATVSLVTAYGRFVQSGRQIMKFPPELTEMLSQTDISDIPLDEIKMPYVSQYLYFGPQPNLELEPGWQVDGAYVETRGLPGDICITVTAVPDDHNLSRLWFVCPEPEYLQNFCQKFRKMSLATAVDTVLSDTLDSLKRKLNKAGGDITEQVKSDFHNAGEKFPDGVRLRDVSPQTARVGLTQIKHRHPIYCSSLQLVVNALCYLTAYPDDVMTVWPEETPASLKNKVEHGKGKEAVRAKSKLASMGYVPVHICGKNLIRQIEAANIKNEGKLLSTHWRRGHWRNQVHGPKHSLRKLIWVMPTLVNSHLSEDGPETGHLYLVS